MQRVLHGPAIDQVLGVEDVSYDTSGVPTSTVYWMLADHQGSVRDVIDSEREIVGHREYDAFGNIISDTLGNLDFAYSFTGREWDADAELYYYRRRWYDPKAARWLSQDPKGFDAGDANFYRYVGNDPVNRIDPMGTDYIDVSNGSVYWNVEENGYAWNTNAARHHVGYLEGDSVQLSARFGGGVVDYYALDNFVGKFWREYPDISGFSSVQQRDYIQDSLNRIIAGGDISTSSAFVEYTGGAIQGLGTGGKAIVNGGANTGVRIVTLGFGGEVEVFEVTDADRARGYDTSLILAEGSFEVLGGIGTGLGFNVLSKGGTVARAAGNLLVIRDVADNTVMVVQAGQDIAHNGVTLQNSVQIVAGGLALRGDFLPAGTSSPNTRLLGHNEYEIIDAAKASRTKQGLLEFYQKHAPRKATIQWVDDVPNGRSAYIDTVTGDIRLSRDFLEPRFSHLADGLLVEELQHFHQLHSRGWFGRSLTAAENSLLEGQVVQRIQRSGFRIFDLRRQ